MVGLSEEIPVDVSPPFQIPCVGLLSTSPSTGPGSSIALLREQLIGTNKGTMHHERSRLQTQTTSELLSVRELLPNLPESPFDNELSGNRLNRDSGQDSSLGNLGGNADTDCIFAYDDNDRDSLCGGDDLEDMPFAWAQAPADPFFLHNNLKSDNNEGNTDAKQSMIAQQCLAPPPLSGFDSMRLGAMRQNSADAFAKFDQMKQFHLTTLSA